ncbi:MAG: 4Fe-4S dicluster domain-containing protein [Actinobacteria bacterium]|nr:4Fe-4S dicluster domain-containing protein [Actinomycetota bacterium]
MSYIGQDIPKLGFGLMRLPKEGGKTDIEQTKAMVDAYMQAGLNYFDTARVYGESEDAIRQALVERYPRDSYYLATKNAAWLGAKTAEEAQAMFETSLRSTGVDYFDFYLLHNLGDTRTAVFDKFDMWEFVKRLKEKGLVKHIGFSMHDSADALEEILVAHSEMEFVQLQINYADWEDGSVQSRRCYETARKYDIPIIIMEPVRGGTLANPPASVAEILSASNPDASYASWALRFAMGLEGVITVLSGMSTIEQMEQNIELYKNYKPLDADEMNAIGKAQRELAKITTIPCTACKYCMKSCPQDINIADIMQSCNRLETYGVADGKNWYGFATMGHGKASECIGCGQCEVVCPQHIGIVGELEKAAAAFE